MPAPYLTDRSFRFLEDLAAHNDRAWFKAHQQRYEDEVRGPLLRFVADFAPRLRKISKNYLADPRPHGGSLFRIHRDTRFAKDKRPYKTHAALRFTHVDGPDVPAPVFYLHVEPGRIFMGAGVWRGQSDVLGPVRDAIVARPSDWRRILSSRAFSLDESHERLKRPPRGYDADHPFIEDLKRKSFLTSQSFTQEEACAPDFLTRYTRACRQRAPLMAFLCGALDRPW